jgi:hypothetical protein
VLIAADIARALVVAATGILSLAGVLEIWMLVVLAVLYGAGEAFFGPAFGALIPEIVAPQPAGRSQLARPARAPGLRAAARAGDRRLHRRGHRCGRGLPCRRRDLRDQRRLHLALRVRSLPARSTEDSERGALREGLAFVRSQPWLWATLIAASLSLLLFLGPLEVLLPFVVRKRPARRRLGYGAILAAAGAGSVLPRFVVSQRGAPRRYLTFAYGAWMIRHAALHRLRVRHRGVAAHALRRSSSGACETADGLCGARSCPRACPAPLRGRVHSLDWFVSDRPHPVSFALTGPLSKAIGHRRDARCCRRPARSSCAWCSTSWRGCAATRSFTRWLGDNAGRGLFLGRRQRDPGDLCRPRHWSRVSRAQQRTGQGLQWARALALEQSHRLVLGLVDDPADFFVDQALGWHSEVWRLRRVSKQAAVVAPNRPPHTRPDGVCSMPQRTDHAAPRLWVSWLMSALRDGRPSRRR